MASGISGPSSSLGGQQGDKYPLASFINGSTKNQTSRLVVGGGVLQKVGHRLGRNREVKPNGNKGWKTGWGGFSLSRSLGLGGADNRVCSQIRPVQVSEGKAWQGQNWEPSNTD